jgi:predicted DNA-binding transcriptional regulator AlpA
VTAPVIVDEAALRRILADAIAPLQAELAAIKTAQATSTSPMLKPKEVARLLNVDERSLRRMALAGDIPPGVRVGSKLLRWPRAVIERWIESGGRDLSIRRRRA